MAIQKRGQTYWLAVRVPKNLEAVYGRPQVRESLGTRDRREAQRLHDVREGELKEEFSRKEAEARGETVLSKSELRKIAVQSLSDFPHHIGADPFNPPRPPLSFYRDEMNDVHSSVSDLLNGTLEAQGLSLGERDRGYLQTVAESYAVEKLQAEIAQILGSSPPPLPQVREPGKAAVKPASPAHASPENLGPKGPLSLIEAVNRYTSRKEFTSKALKTQLSYKDGLDLLCRYFGDGREVHTLWPDDLESFRDSILDRLPPNLPPRGDIVELCKKAEKSISGASKNKHLSSIRGFFRWAKDSANIIRTNPTLALGQFAAKAETTRVPFSDSEIKVIAEDTASEVKEPYRFWLPRLAMYTGARLSELCQLEPTDLAKEQGRWCLRIDNSEAEDGRGKRTKTAGAKRLVPLHKSLIEAGFPAFMQAQRHEHGRIWQEAVWSETNGWGGKLGKNLNRAIGRVVTAKDGEQKSFHSFRHSVSDKLRNAQIEFGVIDAFLGWSTAERKAAMRDQYGDKSISFNKLVSAVDAIAYP